MSVKKTRKRLTRELDAEVALDYLRLKEFEARVRGARMGELQGLGFFIDSMLHSALDELDSQRETPAPS